MRVLLAIAVFGIAICSFAGLLAPFWWFFDLFNHFRVQGAVAALVALALAVAFDRRLAVIAAGSLLLNVGLIGLRLFETGGVPADAVGQPVALVATNVLSSNRDHAAVLAMIAAERPDILVVTELSPAWAAALSVTAGDFPYRLQHPRADNFGIALYARRPFKGQVLASGRFGLPLIVAEFDGFMLIAAHPFPPISTETASENRVYLADVANIARAANLPVVLAGDLNASLWSHSIYPLFDAGLTRVSSSGIAYTWPVGMLPLAIHIDHVLVKGLRAGQFRVLAGVGSDHFPVRADLVITQSAR